MVVLGKDWASFHAHGSLEVQSGACHFRMLEEFVDCEQAEMVVPASRVLVAVLRLSSALLHCYFA